MSINLFRKVLGSLQPIDGADQDNYTATAQAPRAPATSWSMAASPALWCTALKARCTYSDLDLNPEGASVYRWYRDVNVIPGARDHQQLLGQ